MGGVGVCERAGVRWGDRHYSPLQLGGTLGLRMLNLCFVSPPPTPGDHWGPPPNLPQTPSLPLNTHRPCTGSCWEEGGRGMGGFHPDPPTQSEAADFCRRLEESTTPSALPAVHRPPPAAPLSVASQPPPPFPSTLEIMI